MELKLDIPSGEPARLSVSERTAFADDDAHMVHFLKDLIYQKLILQWCKDNGLNTNQYFTLYRYAVGSTVQQRINRRVPIEMAFSARLDIQPAMWYVPYNEQLPAPIAFHPVHAASDILTQPTVARYFLFERRSISTRADLSTISRNSGVKYATLRNLIARSVRSNHPERVWSCFPNATTICALARYIPIDTWFIFPDELDDQSVKDMFIDWPPHENRIDK